MKVAISGVGGAVGQSIMKALTLADLPVEVVAIDVNPLSAGLFRAPKSVVLPKPEEPGGIEQWEEFLKDNEIAALIPGSDYDLIPLASVREKWSTEGICQVLVSDLELVQTCRDKAATCRILERAGIPVPKSAWDLSPQDALAWATSNGYPVVIKPRNGSASRNVHIAEDEEEFTFYFRRTPNPILQEHLNLDGAADEYTGAVFVDRTGNPIGTFMARRELSGGATYRAEVGFWPEINDLLLAVGAAVKPRGVLNVQLRQTKRGPVPFELNIRCSGTSAIRAYFGYNEPEMLLRHYLLNEEITPPHPRPGYAFRYWNEIFVDGLDQEDLLSASISTTGREGTTLAWP